MSILSTKSRATWVSLLSGILLCTSLPGWSAFPSADYFPLYDGATWSYTGDFSNQVLSGDFTVNGVLTKKLQDNNGDSEFFSNDANGIRMHRLGIAFPSSTATFRPPVPMVRAFANIGDQLNSSGKADLYVPGAGTFVINYSSSGKIAATERITVPYGTFDTIRFVLTFRLFGNIQGTPVDETATSTLWLARDIGVVRDDEEGFGVIELVSTNVESKKPAMTINSPAQGATTGSGFNLVFTVNNWDVSPGGKHIHWTLDGIGQGDKTDLAPIAISGLENGPHSISLHLANENHSLTGIEDSVSFVVDNRPIAAAISGIISTILLAE